MKRIYDENKLDLGLFPQTVDTTSVTGEYFTLKNSNIVGCSVLLGNMADGSTAVCQLVQAKDALGTDSKDITGATCTVTANTNVKALTITLDNGLVNGDEIVINGLTFTAHTDTTTVANREFAIDGASATLDADELVTCINDATYGVPGVTASNDTGVITLTCIDPGVGTISATGIATHAVVATLRAGAYLEIPDGLLDVNNDFTHVALKITTDASIICASELIRESERYTPTQYFAAEYLG